MATITGTEFDDVLPGTGDADWILGLAGADTLTGLAGNDTLDGGLGADAMEGGSGDDLYFVDDAGDLAIETTATGDAAGGEDSVAAGISYTLPDGIEHLEFSDDGGDIDGTGNAGDNVLRGNIGANRLLGLAGNDLLDGGAGDDILDGGAGADALHGGAGNDLYIVDHIADFATEQTDDPPAGPMDGDDTVLASVSYTLIGNEIERLTLVGTAALNGTGNDLGNTITGSRADNLLRGGAGDDTIDGGVGKDTLDGGSGSDSLSGGDQDDTYRVDDAGDEVVEAYDDIYSGIDTVEAALSFTLGFGLEHLTLIGSLALDGSGNAKSNSLLGNAGANRLSGGAGNDTLDGGGGNDTLTGGTGNDLYVVNASGDVTTETSTLATEIDTVQSSVGRTLGAYLEKLVLTGAAAINGTGNGLANTITGNAAANRLDGGAGNDTMAGGFGNDTYVVNAVGDVTTETSTLASEIDTVISSVSRGLGIYLEKLVLSGTIAIDGSGNTLANTITGNSAANRLSGLAGNDTLGGGGGNDTLDGGAGNDVLAGDAGADAFLFASTLNATSNVDRIARFVAADDRFLLENAFFRSISPGFADGRIRVGDFCAGAVAADADDRIVYHQASGQLYFDPDGSGSRTAVLFARLDAGTALTAADFFVV